MDTFYFEKREFIRIRCDVPVRYKFISKEVIDPDFEKIYDGTTNNLGGGGLLLVGTVPKPVWLTQLLTHKILVGINLLLPNVETPVKALTRVAWIERKDEKSEKLNFGLNFRDIASSDKDKIFQFIIKSQIG